MHELLGEEMMNSAAEHQRSRAINKIQIKKIHALKNRLGWSDEQYREYLMTEGDGFAVSCKDLSEPEAERLIRKMELAAAAKGVWKRFNGEGQSPRKYDDLGNRPGMASPKQLRKIEAMWNDVSYVHSAAQRSVALRHFIKRIVGVENMRFIKAHQAQKIIRALETMKGREVL